MRTKKTNKRLEEIALQGIILKDDARYIHTEYYLKSRGYIFTEANAPPGSLDFIVFPFMGEIDSSVYNDNYFAALKKEVLIFSGIKNVYLADKCAEYGLSYHIITEDRFVAVKNAVPTSEGVIAYLIANRINTLANSRALIIGYGVCGRDLGKRLKGLEAKVYALVRSQEKEYAAYADSVIPIYLEELLNKPAFDIIINTVPERVLSNEILGEIKGAILIDIASKPYGFDMEYAKKLNEKSALLPGIPGKYAVQSAGEILGEYINFVLEERRKQR